MNVTPEGLNLLQWVISQGIGVAVAVLVLYLVGRKVDEQNKALAELSLAITRLSQQVADLLRPKGL